MKSIDTIKLLQECDAGTKMAVASIDNMLDKVGSQQLKNVLEESKSHHESLGNQIHDMLNEREAFEKDNNGKRRCYNCGFDYRWLQYGN